MYEYDDFNRKKFILWAVITVIVLLAAAFAIVVTQFSVTDVEVEGNEHYTDKQIMEMVLPEGMLNNSLYLAVVYQSKEIKDIPFIEMMDVEIVSNHAIKINVYEKALAGCVNYLGNYMYFDREGIVVETSDQVTEGVPQIKGLTFDHVVMHEKLPVEDPAIFSKILNVTQLLAKYELKADKIFFGTEKDVTLYFDQARIYLGRDENMDEKIMQIVPILPHLEGKSGILNMENFDENTVNIPFNLD
ncbi:MAG: FtsQ-type POTRA domain-containing protein [Lachnospiraceae bacterium]|nr:FtsQ-type POTRA domain-containing protein [Lachnospiraceae bacterium]